MKQEPIYTRLYRRLQFAHVPEPEVPWDTGPVSLQIENEWHAIECVIGGMAGRTVCGRKTGGTVTHSRMYRAEEVPREGLCILCTLALDGII